MTERQSDNFETIQKVKGFWEQNGKKITYAGLLLVLILGGWIAYDKWYRSPRALSAEELIFPAEGLFGKMANSGFNKDSVNIVLNGGTLDGKAITGLLKVISQYDGTPTANRARYMTGACYLQIGQFDKAIQYLKDFKGEGAKQIESKAHLLLGHAYAEKNQTKEALSQYEKAASVNPKDETITPDALMNYAGYAEVAGESKKAIDAYQKIKKEYPNYISSNNGDIDKRLGRLGVVN